MFKDVEYRIAAPVENYIEAFKRALPQSNPPPPSPANCILHAYLYANLEGKQTGSITGPITFGEIAKRQLLNQTLTYLEIVDTAK